MYRVKMLKWNAVVEGSQVSQDLSPTVKLGGVCKSTECPKCATFTGTLKTFKENPVPKNFKRNPTTFTGNPKNYSA